jgi:hypothetical protein
VVVGVSPACLPACLPVLCCSRSPLRLPLTRCVVRGALLCCVVADSSMWHQFTILYYTILQEYLVDAGRTEDRSIAWELAPSLPHMASIESVEFEFEDSDDEGNGGMMMGGVMDDGARFAARY